MSSVLEICQDVARLAAVQPPSNLFNPLSQHDGIFLSVITSTLESLRRYGEWQELTKEGNLTTFPNKKSYLITDFCPDFFSLIHNTIYIKDEKKSVIGAITAEQWMKQQIFEVPSLNLSFKIQGNRLLFSKEPGACYTIVFNYRSNALVYELDKYRTIVEKPKITANTDVPVFDEYLVKLGALWRWYKRNGMPYEEEFNEYEQEVKAHFGMSLAKKDIFLAGYYFENECDGVMINAVQNIK